MAALEVLALNTVIPQIQAPQVGDTYLFPRAAEFSAGTALLPSLAATGDLDTGMWFPAANTVAWSTGGSERMRITSAGEVGIGTSTPTGFIPLTILANSNNAIALNIRGRSDGIGVLLFTDNSDVENGRIDFRTNYAEIKQTRNAPLVFSTNGSEKMRLTAAGDLGLGTTPGGGMKLDILGGNVNLTNATYAAYQVVSGAVTGQLAANAGGTVDVRAVSNHPLLLYTNNTERMRITSAGLVGIGKTAASGVLLDVNGIIHGGERLQLTNGFANVSMLEAAGGIGYRWALANNGTYRLQRTANGTYSDATTPILFDASNNVGIGTTSPITKLHIFGSNTQARIESNATSQFSGALLALKTNVSTSNQQQIYLGNVVGDSANSQGIFIIGQYDGGGSFVQTLMQYSMQSNAWRFSTAGLEKMCILSDGNVGVGISTPLFALHVYRNANTEITATATNAGTNSAGFRLENEGQRNWQIWADRTNDAMQLGHNSRNSVVLALKPGGQTRFVPLAAAPTSNVQDGDVYYDSGTNKLRVRAGGAWTDLH